MQIRNYSPRTIQTYVSHVKHLSDHYNLAPAKISLEDFKVYLSYRINSERISVSTINQAIGAWRLLQVDVLKREWEDFKVKRPLKEKKLPSVLSRSEALLIINALGNLKHRTLLTLTYTTGLRRNELLSLKPEDIDSSRHLLKVVNGKGHKQRLIPISNSMIDILRDYYKYYRPSVYLFEGISKGTRYSESSFNNIVKKAARISGIKKQVSPHTLRHSFATHMLEKGVNLKRLQIIMGHSAMKTTSIYLHVTELDNVALPDLSIDETLKDKSI